MTCEVRLRPEAEQDLADAAAWYEERQQGWGHKFLDEVTITLSNVAETPLAYPNVHRGTRRAMIRRFPFGIYFQAEKATIIVVAVMHGSRNPHRWKNPI